MGNDTGISFDNLVAVSEPDIQISKLQEPPNSGKIMSSSRMELVDSAGGDPHSV
mgnify:FL=1|jgi:hypothetical protein